MDPQHYLPLGLLGSYCFATCKRSKIRRLFADVARWEANDLLAYTINDANHRLLPTIRSLAKEEEDIWILKQVAYDDDAGPRDAWRWAHFDLHADSWFAVEEYKDLRLWGYVMWNSTRLEEWGVLR